jgi:CO/xanthine dehydrogenase FAD-binding subunit
VWLESGSVRSPDDEVPIGDLIATMSDLVEGSLVIDETYIDTDVDPTSQFSIGNKTANASPSYAFAAHAVELEVDQETGQIRIIDYVAVHDVGKAINPVQTEGQIIGGVIMGLGATLREELQFEQGRVTNPSYMNYGLLRAADAPHIRVILLEDEAPSGPFGAKNVGELSVLPVAAAVANAVRDATGIRVRDLPITPDKIVQADVSRRRPFHFRAPSRWWISLVRWLYPRGLFALLHHWGTRFARPRDVHPITAVATPTGLDDLVELVRKGSKPIGAGTDVQLLRRQGLGGQSRLAAVGLVRELNSIESENDGSLRIGAAVTLAQLGSELRQSLPVMLEVVQTIASPQVRSVATVGGNLLQEKRCVFYRNGFNCYKRGGPTCPCYAILGDHRFYHSLIGSHRCQAVTPSDLATALVAMDAVAVVARSGYTRRLPVRRLYSGPGENCLSDEEVLTHVIIPASAARKRNAFEKLQLWAGDFAVASAMVAADIDELGRWRGLTICLGGLAPIPWVAVRTARQYEAKLASPARLREALTRELEKTSHPLPRNEWKIRVAGRLVEKAAERVSSG